MTTRLAAALVLALMALSGMAVADDGPDAVAQQCAAEDSMLGLLTMKAGAELSEADRGYTKSIQAMQQSLMKTEMSGDASGDFARTMILHQQSAIDMVDVLLAQKDVGPDLRRMAEATRAARAREIVEMQAWLERHRQ